MLVFIDKALVTSLIVMVMLSGYENFISRIDVDGSNHTLSWLGKLDPGSIKVKVASSIVAISSIHLLQVFLNISQAKEQWHVVWQTLIHMAFVLSAVLLGYLSLLTHHDGD
ncbi:MAG: YqhA family protein [Deltaproteobacteria bacterium]|nr:YqhA family protein [Deltaproteobacteria bacterium]